MPGGIGTLDAVATHNEAAGREIGPLDKPAKLISGGLRVVNEIADGIAHLTQIVRRDVGGHAHGNARAAINQQIGGSGGQDGWLLEAAVKVGHKVNGILINVKEHLLSNLGQAGLGITHGRRRVVIHAAKIALAINQRVAHRY
ncbi:hypothetical protein ES703_55594 [subsurface metagenome]